MYLLDVETNDEGKKKKAEEEMETNPYLYRTRTLTSSRDHRRNSA